MNILERLTDFEKRPQARPYAEREYDLPGFRSWLDALGNPQDRTAWIHLAGTKGKGSTACLCESILNAGGMRTALFTSPHLDHYGQRFRLNTREWTEEEFGAALSGLEPVLLDRQRDALARPHTLRTVFEVLTALAFIEFARAGTEIGVLEVGLGGRLDCTNVVDPLVSVITPVEMDHAKILGDTVERIAGEKAGIIKSGRPVVLFEPRTDLQRRARAVADVRAAEVRAPILAPVAVRPCGRDAGGQMVEFEWEGVPVTASMPLLGDHQARNLGLALAACRAATEAVGRRLTAGDVKRGVEQVRWPGRLEIRTGDPTLALDGAHCTLSARVLGEALVGLGADLPAPRILLWGMQGDKDRGGFLDELLGRLGPGWLAGGVTYQVGGGRGEDPGKLAELLRERGVEASGAACLEEAVDMAARAAGAGSILATGTLYALSPIARLLEKRKGGVPKDAAP